MKITAHSPSETARGCSAFDFATAKILLGFVIATAFWGCDRADSRVTDPELARLIENIGLSPAEERGRTLCAALPQTPGGIMVIQEIAKEHSVAMALRFASEKSTDGTTRYAVESLRIRTAPTEIPWNIRLEEEMENWVASVTPGATPADQEPSLSMGDNSQGISQEKTPLHIFKNTMATGLGSLHILREWCTPDKTKTRRTPLRIHLNVPGKPSLLLQAHDANARIVAGDAHWELSTITGGIQAVRAHSRPQTAHTKGNQLIFKVLSIEQP